MANYNDIYVRDSFNDVGQVPTTDDAWKSPDIIPYQNAQLWWDLIVGTYPKGPDLAKDFVNPGINNIYVRAKNLQPSGTESGQVSLYYCPPSLFMNPSQWVKNVITTASGNPQPDFVNQNGSTQLNPNDIAISSPCFFLSRLPQLKQDNHYCFIAVVKTPNHTVTIPDSFPSTADFVSWVQNQPAVAWRNVALIPSSKNQILQILTFGSSDPEDNRFHFSIVGSNLPVGTQVNVQFDIFGSQSWSGTLPAPDETGEQIIGFDQIIPANYTGALTISATPPQGQAFTPGATLIVKCYEYPPDNIKDEHKKLGKYYKIARANDKGIMTLDTISLIQVGECTAELT